MIYTHIAAALISAAIAATGAWQVQSWLYGEKIASMKQAASEATTKAVKAAMEKTQVDQKRKDDALIESNKRAQKNAVAAANANTAVNGLRDELATARADLSKATIYAAREYGKAATDVIGECANSLTEMARENDTIYSEKWLLIDAWPN